MEILKECVIFGALFGFGSAGFLALLGFGINKLFSLFNIITE